MSRNYKTIRSSSWQTDFLIGFPEGLLLLFFTTGAMQGLNITVQLFYTINTCIWLIVAFLVMVTAYQANKGDAQHDEGSLSDEERKKLEDLDIHQHIIADIADEMEKDAGKWETTLEEEQVQVGLFHTGKALRSAFVTWFFFLLGGIIPFLPYLRNENFSAAHHISIWTAYISMVLFSLFKARMTSQKITPVVLRNIAYTTGVYIGAFILGLIFS